MRFTVLGDNFVAALLEMISRVFEEYQTENYMFIFRRLNGTANFVAGLPQRLLHRDGLGLL